MTRAQKMIDDHFRRQDLIEKRKIVMDKDNFKYFIGPIQVEMIGGQLFVDGIEYETEEEFEYAMTRRLAYEAGCFDDDSDIPAVIFDK